MPDLDRRPMKIIRELNDEEHKKLNKLLEHAPELIQIVNKDNARGILARLYFKLLPILLIILLIIIAVGVITTDITAKL